MDDHSVSPVSRLVSFLELERRDVWVIVVYAIAVGLLTLAVPVTTQSLVNTVAFGSLLQPIVVLTLILITALGFSALFQSIQTYLVELIQRRVFVRVVSRLAHQLPRLKVEALEGAYGPELVNRFFDIVTVQKSASILLLDGLLIFLQTAIGMILLAFYHPLLLAFDIVLMLSVAFILFGLGRRGTSTAIHESHAKYSVAAWLEEITRHPTTFRSTHATRFACERADALVTQYLHARDAHFKVVLRQIIGSLSLHTIASAALLGLGGVLVVQRQLTLGQLIAAELIVSGVLLGVSKFGKYLETYYDLLAAVHKVGSVLDLPLERADDEGLSCLQAGPLTAVSGVADDSVNLGAANQPVGGTTANGQATVFGVQIEATGVSYVYPDGRHGLRNVDLMIPAGAKVALVGPSGSGKSTWLSLLYGLYRPTEGVLQINGVPIQEISLHDLRRWTSLVRENEIFHGSVADNVRMGRTDVTGDDVRRALREVGLLDELAAKPDGTQTMVQTGGAPLSKGQVRRLLLSRALVNRPRLLLLDEHLDGLDTKTHEVVLDTLFAKHCADTPWTLVISTQRDSIAQRCDVVYTFSDGRLVKP
jgi:putative ABC transport system ATP-binding protein